MAFAPGAIMLVAAAVTVALVVCTYFALHNSAAWIFLKSKRPQGFLYQLKWFGAYIYFQFIRHRKKRLLNYDFSSTNPHLLGFLPSHTEIALDRPQDLKPGADSFDSSTFWGVASNGSSLLLHIVRRPSRHAEVWLYLNLAGVGEFQLPIHPDTNVYNGDGKNFSASGLRFEVLEPMRKWRVSYNGLIRKGIFHSMPDSDESINAAEDQVHLKFSLLWTPLAQPFDYNYDFHAGLLADAVAHDKWSVEYLSHLSRNIHDRYEQSGQLYGTVNVLGTEEKVLLFRGIRSHAFGTFSWDRVQRYLDVRGYLKDGTFLHLGVIKMTGGPTQLLYGYLIKSSSVLHSIAWCDLTLENYGCDQYLPRHMAIKFFAGKRMYHLDTVIDNAGFTAYNGERWSNKLQCRPVHIYLDSRPGYGLVEFAYRFEGDCPLPFRMPVALLSPIEKPLTPDCPLVVSIKQERCRNPLLVGGKAMSLALLNLLNEPKITVPKAVCVTTKAYFLHLGENPDLQMAVQKLEDIAWGKTKGNLRETCHRVMNSISNVPLSVAVQDAVTLEMQLVFSSKCHTLKFAVRSSATGEDGEEMSAAGQNDTYLGVVGMLEIFDAVVQCWASQFSYVAVEYKRQNGQLINPGMAIVIQEMVSSDYAGVMFTQDPVSGNPNLITITANYGLGETVVSATAEPDTIILQRALNNEVTIKEKILGSKRNKVILNDVGGTQKVNLEWMEAETYCISDEMSIRLAKLGILIEQSFGAPRDVEWAISRGNLYLLQARPITSFNRETDFELIHEFDSPVRTDSERVTTANTGEVFPGAATPLTVSSMVKVLDIAIQNNVQHQNSLISSPVPHYIRYMTVTHQHILLNCIDLIYRTGNAADNIIYILELSIFGHLVDDPDLRKLSEDRYKDSQHSSLKTNLNLASIVLKNNSVLRRMIKEYESFDVPTTFTTSLEIYKSISDHVTYLFNASYYHAQITTISSFWNLIALLPIIHGKPATEWTTNSDIFADVALLLSNCSDVESADVPAALKDLAKAILEDQKGLTFANEMSKEEALIWLKGHSGAAGRKFKDFLNKHGHRCLKEFDFISESWRMNPLALLSVLQSMTKNPSQLDSQKSNLNVSETLEKLKTPLSWSGRLILSWILPKYRRTVGFREKSKSLLIRTIDRLRQAYLHLANKMVEEGRIPDAALIHFFTHQEIGQLLTTRSPKLIAKANRRKNLQSKLEDLQFPEIVIGIPNPEATEEKMKITESSVKVTGTPVCQGVITGVARVIRKLEEAPTIEPGDILITHSTDIGWSPYFPLLSGVVTELGGIISHGAVVAREYGLPCIVGTRKATHVFQTGDKIILNGTMGFVQKIEITS